MHLSLIGLVYFSSMQNDTCWSGNNVGWDIQLFQAQLQENSRVGPNARIFRASSTKIDSTVWTTVVFHEWTCFPFYWNVWTLSDILDIGTRKRKWKNWTCRKTSWLATFEILWIYYRYFKFLQHILVLPTVSNLIVLFQSEKPQIGELYEKLVVAFKRHVTWRILMLIPQT